MSLRARGTDASDLGRRAPLGADPAVVDQLTVRLSAVVDRTDPEVAAPIVLFSGGLDSSLLAHLLARRRRPTLRTVGRSGSADLEAAGSGAGLLRLPWTGSVLSDGELEVAWAGWGAPLHALPEPRRSVLFALGLAFERAAGGPVWIGQGADELFGGYAHFDGLSPEAAEKRATADLERLRTRDWPATLALAATHRVSVRAPYLEPGVVGFVEGLAPEHRFPGPDRKALLRRVAAAVGLPAELVGRKKRAMQYGSGIHRWVRRQLSSLDDRPARG